MVERTKTELINEFDGICLLIEKIPDQMNEGREQYHLDFEPMDKEILKDSKTHRFHAFIRITAKTTDNTVSEGSVLDRYIQEIETIFPEAKKMKNITEVLQLLLNKKIHYVNKKLGRAFHGYEAKPVFVPQKLL